ncbi:MAG: ceramidase domain-containing protein [Anaerolineae bacterium]|nr:ceramidase domain-containing protein [Anaerolineae bacterium]
MSTKERWALYGLIVPFSILIGILAVALITTVSANLWLPALLWATLTVGAVLVLGLVFHWIPTSANDSDYDDFLNTGDPEKIIFCEGYDSGWVKQPISVWSNLAFVASGLMIVLILGTRAAPAPNPMADPTALIPLAYALAVTFMGPGSMVFHASLKKWAGWFDNLSIILWAGLSLSYTVTRLLMSWFGAPLELMWLLFGLIALIVGIVTFRSESSHRTTQIVVAGSWFLVELFVMIAAWLGYTPGFVRSTPWFLAVVASFAAAFACWLPSGAVARLWCDPDSPIQGHGFWHVLAAIGTLLVYCYFASEIAML